MMAGTFDTPPTPTPDDVVDKLKASAARMQGGDIDPDLLDVVGTLARNKIAYARFL